MLLDKIINATKHLPFMTVPQGILLYHFIRKLNPKHCLELGCYHGVSTAYIASALEDNNHGDITSLDFEYIRQLDPSPESLISSIGLSHRAKIRLSVSGYNWDMMNIINERTVNNSCIPKFDFCFIDGSHLWETDGMAFFLVEKLIRPGGWIVFDDVDWTVEDDFKLMSRDNIYRNLPSENKKVAQVRHIVDLLVKQHPSVQNVFLKKDITGWTWAWAVKKRTEDVYEDLPATKLLDKAYSSAYEQIQHYANY